MLDLKSTKIITCRVLLTSLKLTSFSIFIDTPSTPLILLTLSINTHVLHIFSKHPLFFFSTLYFFIKFICVVFIFQKGFRWHKFFLHSGLVRVIHVVISMDDLCEIIHRDDPCQMIYDVSPQRYHLWEIIWAWIIQHGSPIVDHHVKEIMQK